jgi:hypothetical protein
MKQCTEYVCGLRYKLRMISIPCGDEHTYISGDDQQSVWLTLELSSPSLHSRKSRKVAIAYHFVQERCAQDEWRTAYVNTHLNPADLLTKPLWHSAKRRGFVRMLLHHIFPNDETVE